MKTIAIVDPFNAGHHQAFMQLSVRALSRTGARVVVLFPEPQILQDWMALNSASGNFEIYYYAYGDVHKPSTRFGIFNDAVTVLKKWWRLKKTLKQIERKDGFKIDMVFLGWVDAYLANFLLPVVLDRFFHYPWSGLYFHPTHLRVNSEILKPKSRPSEIDYILTSKNCIAIALHDEGICNILSERLSGKSVLLFPEIADDAEPDFLFKPAKEIKRRAKNRTIVGMIGLLDRRKGIKMLVESVLNLNPADYFFVFAGKTNLEHFNEDDQQFVANFFRSEPENVFTHFEYIPEGAEFNAVFDSLDIVFLVYEEFASSSNRLTKAAIFNKPVIAQNRYCVGEDVVKYHLGLTINETDTAECISSIQKIKEMLQSCGFPDEGFRQYKKLHSHDELENKFKNLRLIAKN